MAFRETRKLATAFLAATGMFGVYKLAETPETSPAVRVSTISTDIGLSTPFVQTVPQTADVCFSTPFINYTALPTRIPDRIDVLQEEAIIPHLEAKVHNEDLRSARTQPMFHSRTNKTTGILSSLLLAVFIISCTYNTGLVGGIVAALGISWLIYFITQTPQVRDLLSQVLCSIKFTKYLVRQLLVGGGDRKELVLLQSHCQSLEFQLSTSMKNHRLERSTWGWELSGLTDSNHFLRSSLQILSDRERSVNQRTRQADLQEMDTQRRRISLEAALCGRQKCHDLELQAKDNEIWDLKATLRQLQTDTVNEVARLRARTSDLSDSLARHRQSRFYVARQYYAPEEPSSSGLGWTFTGTALRHQSLLVTSSPTENPENDPPSQVSVVPGTPSINGVEDESTDDRQSNDHISLTGHLLIEPPSLADQDGNTPGSDDHYDDGSSDPQYPLPVVTPIELDSMAGENPQMEDAERGQVSTQNSPTQTLPTQTSPIQTLPTQTSPTQTSPTQTSHTQTLPTQTLPTQTLPTQTLPTPTSQPVEAVLNFEAQDASQPQPQYPIEIEERPTRGRSLRRRRRNRETQERAIEEHLENSHDPSTAATDAGETQNHSQERMDEADSQITQTQQTDAGETQNHGQERIDEADSQITQDQQINAGETQYLGQERMDEADSQITQAQQIDAGETQNHGQDRMDIAEPQSSQLAQVVFEESRPIEQDQMDFEQPNLGVEETMDFEQPNLGVEESMDFEQPEVALQDSMDTEHPQETIQDTMDFEQPQSASEEIMDFEQAQPANQDTMDVEQPDQPQPSNHDSMDLEQPAPASQEGMDFEVSRPSQEQLSLQGPTPAQGLSLTPTQSSVPNLDLIQESSLPEEQSVSERPSLPGLHSLPEQSSLPQHPSANVHSLLSDFDSIREEYSPPGPRQDTEALPAQETEQPEPTTIISPKSPIEDDESDSSSDLDDLDDKDLDLPVDEFLRAKGLVEYDQVRDTGHHAVEGGSEEEEEDEDESDEDEDSDEDKDAEWEKDKKEKEEKEKTADRWAIQAREIRVPKSFKQRMTPKYNPFAPSQGLDELAARSNEAPSASEGRTGPKLLDSYDRRMANFDRQQAEALQASQATISSPAAPPYSPPNPYQNPTASPAYTTVTGGQGDHRVVGPSQPSQAAAQYTPPYGNPSASPAYTTVTGGQGAHQVVGPSQPSPSTSTINPELASILRTLADPTAPPLYYPTPPPPPPSSAAPPPTVSTTPSGRLRTPASGSFAALTSTPPSQAPHIGASRAQWSQSPYVITSSASPPYNPQTYAPPRIPGQTPSPSTHPAPQIPGQPPHPSGLYSPYTHFPPTIPGQRPVRRPLVGTSRPHQPLIPSPLAQTSSPAPALSTPIPQNQAAPAPQPQAPPRQTTPPPKYPKSPFASHPSRH